MARTQLVRQGLWGQGTKVGGHVLMDRAMGRLPSGEDGAGKSRVVELGVHLTLRDGGLRLRGAPGERRPALGPSLTSPLAPLPGALHQHGVHPEEAWRREGRAFPCADRHVQAERERGVH